MPTPSTADRFTLAPVLSEDLEAGSAPLGGPANDAIAGDPLPETLSEKRSFRDHVKAHPVLAIALGGLAIGAIAAFAGRGAIARTAIQARPHLIKAVRPHLIKAATRRPFNTAKLAARYPKVAARIAAGLRG